MSDIGPDDGTAGGPGPAPEAFPATPGQRLGGAVVDGALLQVANLALTGLDQPVAAAVSVAIYLVYVVGMVAARGHTVGKLALGAQVADGASGRLPTLWQAATRGVVPMAGVVVDVLLGVAVLGVFWVAAVYGSILLDERRRGLHDKAAGTVVLAVERSEQHRRVGVGAVVAAVVVTAVLVVQAFGELEEERLEGAGGAAGGLPAAAVA